MERREEAETYHPAVQAQRGEQVVRTSDEPLRIPLVAEHHVLAALARLWRRLLFGRQLRRLAACADIPVMRPIKRLNLAPSAPRPTVPCTTRFMLRDEPSDHRGFRLVRVHRIFQLLSRDPLLLRPLAQLPEFERFELGHQSRQRLALPHDSDVLAH